MYHLWSPLSLSTLSEPAAVQRVTSPPYLLQQKHSGNIGAWFLNYVVFNVLLCYTFNVILASPRLSCTGFIACSESMGMRPLSYSVCLCANLLALCITPLSGMRALFTIWRQMKVWVPWIAVLMVPSTQYTCTNYSLHSHTPFWIPHCDLSYTV